MLFLMVMVAFAMIWRAMAESEGESGLVWGGISVLVSILSMGLGWGLLGPLLGQVALFIGIGIYRALRKS